jgi:chemotaxis protein histidine kinase CheA
MIVENSVIESNLKELFRDEAEEGLRVMESSLIALEKDHGNKEHVAILFRSIHNIKSSSSMVKLINISKYAHEIETVLGFLRDDKIKITQNFMDICLSCIDVLKQMVLDYAEADEKIDSNAIENIKKLKSFIPDQDILISEDEIELELFRGKAYKFLNDIEKALFALEENINSKRNIEIVYRSFQRLKSASQNFEIISVLAFIRTIDAFLSDFRDGNVNLTTQVVEAIFNAADVLRTMVDAGRESISGIENTTVPIQQKLLGFCK